ncbi:MAG: hypothetical protein WBA57_12370 [Elainellaceae cyanobacterium]
MALSLTVDSQPQEQLIALWGWGQTKAAAKTNEGRAQEAIGNMTGDPQDQFMGQAKQVEGRIRGAAADVQDQMQLKGRAKAVTKNIEGKTQSAIGKATGNFGDQVAGSAKQIESQARNAVEDVKDMTQDIVK